MCYYREVPWMFQRTSYTSKFVHQQQLEKTAMWRFTHSPGYEATRAHWDPAHVGLVKGRLAR